MSSRTESMPQSDQIAALAQLGERDYRALTETMTVLDECAPAPASADGLYHVTTGSGASYVVEPELGACDCPDVQYRDAICKHILRVRYEIGQEPLPNSSPKTRPTSGSRRSGGSRAKPSRSSAPTISSTSPRPTGRCSRPSRRGTRRSSRRSTGTSISGSPTTASTLRR